MIVVDFMLFDFFGLFFRMIVVIIITYYTYTHTYDIISLTIKLICIIMPSTVSGT